MDTINDFFSLLSSWLWGWPMIVLLLGTHVFLTFRLRIPQRKLLTGIRLSVRKDDGAKGDVSQFGALATALAATIGTGNIVGVATAITTGGPGAIFWMEIAALFGMATKYAEGLLAVKYREIAPDGRVLGGDILQVGGFINQQIDTSFTLELAREVFSLFSDLPVTKVLTIEASGIAFGFAVSLQFGVPLVFAKKSRTSNVDGAVLFAPIHSFTHGNDYNATVSAEYIKPEDNVLIVDDFLANGEALRGLIKIVNDAGASVVGA